MTATKQLVDDGRVRTVNELMSRLPKRTFGDTDWVTLALKNCAVHLGPAIRSGKAHQIATAVRAIAHGPSLEQVDDIVRSACDSLLGEAYAVRNMRLISNVEGAKTVIGAVVGELRERAARDAVAPALLREMVDGYVRLIGLLNQQAAERLNAVSDLAVRIGSTLQQPPAVLLDLEFAGRLHDVGILSISGSDGSDGAGESHAVAGETFLKTVPSLAHLAPIVRSHHERFDGQGYPDGLRGDEIPLASRIISVAASFIDLVSGSDQIKALPPRDACRDLIRGAGAQFDPDVVNAMLNLLNFRQRTNRSA